MSFDRRSPAGMVFPAGDSKAGQPLPQDLFLVELDFTTGNGKGLDLSGTAAATQKITFTQDTSAHLVLVGGIRVVTDFATDAALVAFIPATVKMQTTSSGRDIMNTPVHVEALFGTAQLPAEWARPKFLAAGASLTTTVVNLSAATKFNLRIMFQAYQIFLS